MTSAKWRSILGHLPVKAPSPEDLAAICPHLEPADAVEAFLTFRYIAVPALRIKGSFHVVSYQQEYVEDLEKWQKNAAGKDERVVVGRKNHSPCLNYAFYKRDQVSYTDDQQHRSRENEYPFIEEAIEFAENNWGDELIEDDWQSITSFIIQDPSDLVNDRYHQDSPRTKATLTVALSRDKEEIMNDTSKPESTLFDEAIAQMTTDSIIGSELGGNIGKGTNYNCAYCGSGLDLSECKGCGHRFQDDYIRSGWDTPLSPKMVELLRAQGHEFKMDPNIAISREHQRWEARHRAHLGN